MERLIQFLMLENVHGRLCAVYKNLNIIIKSKVNYWLKSFKEGRTSTNDEARIGHFPESMNDETIAIVHALLEEDWRQTVCDIEQRIVR